MILRDPIHGLIAFETVETKLLIELLQTREMQRLRRIKQLGLAVLAFPGADHSRFSHALGATHVMQLLIERLRQVDQDLPFWQKLTTSRAKEVLAAAMLHDLGHGPLSHLFEESLPESTRHEDWTEKILMDPGTEVHQVLKKEDPNLVERVVSLIRGKHELHYLAKTVSGTFDVDRADYLLRDAHATGVRFGEFDLPWLLRSLVIDLKDGIPFLALDGTKGMSGFESFLLARFFMFQQVYLHKAARAAEWMFKQILQRVFLFISNGSRIEKIPPAFSSSLNGFSPSIEDYLDLDDEVLWSSISLWQNATDPILSDLCKRLRGRHLFKSIEIFPNSASPSQLSQLLLIAKEVAVQYGLDPEIYVGLDVATDLPYSTQQPMDVLFPNGVRKRPHEASFLLDRLRNESIQRTRLIVAPELRDAVQKNISSILT